MIMVGTHDWVLVVLSILIAAFASFTALSLAPRIRASVDQIMRRVWLTAAALALGGGIWSMHFVAMLAFSIPGMRMSYDLGLTLVSLVLAIVFTGAGFAAISRGANSLPRILAAGLLMGSGIVAMHYVGMSAMRMDADISYGRLWFSLSVLIAIVAAVAAVWLASLDHKLSHRAAAAVVMGGAIAGMHYAGMRAAVFRAAGHIDLAQGGASLTQTYLAATISVLTFVILLLALGAARLDRAFRAYARREARIALRLRIADVLREGDTDLALHSVVGLMGAHFRVARAGFCQLDPIEDVFDCDVCWTDGTVAPLVGRIPTAIFGESVVAQLQAGRTIAVEDRSATDPKAFQTRSFLVVPFVREGRLRTIVYLGDRRPRTWYVDDIRFMEELAERTRLVLERTAVERQLRELNATLEARVEARTAQLREAEEARHAADALYRAFFENAPEALFIIGVGADGTFIAEQVNPAHETGLGFTTESIQGRRLDEVLPPAATGKVLEACRQVVATGEVVHYRNALELTDGLQFWDSTIAPLHNVDGQVVRLLGSSRNVTREVLAEEALRQSQKMEAIGSLTGGVAHDFNNLLTPIMGTLDRLRRKGLGDEREQRLIAGALTSAERAKVLVQRLLAFARRQPLMPVPVDVAKLIAGMADLVSSTVGPKIRIEIDVAEPLPSALADLNQLEMALLNLCVNARDAMPDGGVLSLAAAEERIETEGARSSSAKLAPGAYIRLSVTDSGIGMDEATRERAVEPFFSTKGVGQGTGLGLSMVHGLAGQLGGTLTIESQVGRGTRVTLWIPQSQDASTAPVAATTAAPAVRTAGSALLVDDEEPVRAATAAMLADLGYGVVEAQSAEEALGLIADGLAVDLVVTDYLMGGKSGAQLAAELHVGWPGLPVLVMTGYAEQDRIPANLPLLTKPFLLAELSRKIDEIAGGSETRSG